MQYQPNMGSTCAIAVCPQNTDVRVRIAEGDNDTAPGFCTTDGGKTWTKMKNTPGGYAAIAQLENGKYRIFHSSSINSKNTEVRYSDDLGITWESCEDIPSAYGSKPTQMFVEPDGPSTVYAYVTYYNESWVWSKSQPDEEDMQYKLCISTDHGKTFHAQDICTYDRCDSAGRIAYLGKPGELILGGGYYGLYHVTVQGGKITAKEKLDGISYCKAVGYGAPETAGAPNALYIYGRTDASAPEGIYRSTDAGKTWVCINTTHLYGGTGNGNFIVGDMDEFGKVYMSTVGCGIVYGKPAGASDSTVPGDVNADGTLTVKDVILMQKWLLAVPDTRLPNKKAADLSGDKILDVFDLSLMKRELLAR